MRFDLDNEKLNTVYSISETESEHSRNRFKFGIVHLDYSFGEYEREFAVGMKDLDNNYYSFLTNAQISEMNPIKVSPGTELRVRKYIGKYNEGDYTEEIMTVDSESRLYNPDNSLIIVLDIVDNSSDVILD